MTLSSLILSKNLVGINLNGQFCKKNYFVYILICRDDSYNVGLTNDLLIRFQQHIDGEFPTCYTFKRRALRLLYHESIPFLKEAMERENSTKRLEQAKEKSID